MSLSHKKNCTTFLTSSLSLRTSIKERYLNLTSISAHSLSVIPHSFLMSSDMETTPPFAPDSAAGNSSAGAKEVGGVAGVILVIILAIIYVILRRGRCSLNCEVGVKEAASRSGAEEG
uniref:Uncharacterized protein n=1 Tax=Salix viminalis TaxID=40686 RepID=A0A6N2MFH9_SALVM